MKIIHRPEEIDARLIPGHWEGDLLKGASNRSSVGTRVERKTLGWKTPAQALADEIANAAKTIAIRN